MTDEELIALADRLTVPTDADHIYEWVVEARKKHRSDFPRMGFAIEMELIDDDRLAAAAAIRALVAERGRVMEWLPMDTAPKDGSPILVKLEGGDIEISDNGEFPVACVVWKHATATDHYQGWRDEDWSFRDPAAWQPIPE